MSNDMEHIQKDLNLLALNSYYGINPKPHDLDVEVKMLNNIQKGDKK